MGQLHVLLESSDADVEVCFERNEVSRLRGDGSFSAVGVCKK